MAYGGFLNALIVIVVGLALLPVVSEFVELAVNTSSSTGQILLPLIELFWILAVVFVAVKMTGMAGGKRS